MNWLPKDLEFLIYDLLLPSELIILLPKLDPQYIGKRLLADFGSINYLFNSGLPNFKLYEILSQYNQGDLFEYLVYRALNQWEDIEILILLEALHPYYHINLDSYATVLEEKGLLVRYIKIILSPSTGSISDYIQIIKGSFYLQPKLKRKIYNLVLTLAVENNLSVELIQSLQS